MDSMDAAFDDFWGKTKKKNQFGEVIEKDIFGLPIQKRVPVQQYRQPVQQEMPEQPSDIDTSELYTVTYTKVFNPHINEWTTRKKYVPLKKASVAYEKAQYAINKPVVQQTTQVVEKDMFGLPIVRNVPIHGGGINAFGPRPGYGKVRLSSKEQIALMRAKTTALKERRLAGREMGISGTFSRINETFTQFQKQRAERADAKARYLAAKNEQMVEKRRLAEAKFAQRVQRDTLKEAERKYSREHPGIVQKYSKAIQEKASSIVKNFSAPKEEESKSAWLKRIEAKK